MFRYLNLVQIFIFLPCYISAEHFASESSIHDVVSGQSVCEARTINYITHALPQSCLTTSWTTADSAPTNQPNNIQTDETGNDVSSTTGGGISAGFQTTASEAEEVQEPEVESNASPFMSFEDWKEMMLRQTGQDPQDLTSRKNSRAHDEERTPPDMLHSELGEEDEISLNFDSYLGRGGEQQDFATDNAAEKNVDQALQQSIVHEEGIHPIHPSKDAGKTCKERFSYASFDAGATVLKTSTGAKNAKAILVENKDSYMLLECSSGSKYVIVELSDDILVDTVVLANFEFFSSMIRHFRISVSDRYPVKMEKWRELGTFEARNSRDIQPFLIQNPQIWAKYVRIEFLTHYGKEYYCPVSLLRVHGSRMLDSWKESEASRDEDHTEIEETIEPPPEHLLAEELPAGANSEVAEVEPTVTRTHQDLEAILASQCLLTSTVWYFEEGQATCGISKLQNDGVSEIQSSTDATYNLPAEEVKAEDRGADIGSNYESTILPAVPSSSVPVTTSISQYQNSNLNSDLKTPSQAATGANTTLMQSITNTDSTVSTRQSSPSSILANRNRTSTTTTQSPPAAPTVQEGFFKAMTKRLQQVESNLTLSLKYVENQSRHMQETLQKTENKQILKVTAFLEALNQTVLAELRIVRDQYDQMWQSTVIALESQRDQSQREIVALSTRLNLLADEVVFQKRMAIIQAVLLLSCLLLVIFSRGVPLPYLAPLAEQTSTDSYRHPAQRSMASGTIYDERMDVDSDDAVFLHEQQKQRQQHTQLPDDIVLEPFTHGVQNGQDLSYTQDISHPELSSHARSDICAPLTIDSADEPTSLSITASRRDLQAVPHIPKCSVQHNGSRKPLPALPEHPSSP